jgi:hypothetical protein
MIHKRRDRILDAAIHQDSEIESVVVSLYELSAYAFACLADSCKDYRSPAYLINALGRVEIPVLSLPSRVWPAIAQCAAVWFYNNIHLILK